MKNIYFLVGLIFIGSINSCQKNTDINKELVEKTEQIELSEQEIIEISNSTEMKNFLEVRFEIIDRIQKSIDKGNSIKSIELAANKVVNGDDKTFNILVFESNIEAEQYYSIYQKKYDELFSKYPKLLMIPSVKKSQTDLKTSIDFLFNVNNFFLN